MDAATAATLSRGGTADITTTGAKTGTPHRIEIWFHHHQGGHYIGGRPGKRDWLANMIRYPDFTLHLKEGVHADLPVTASVITDADVRRAVSYQILTERLGTQPDEAEAELDRWVSDSPLVRFFLPPLA